MSYVKVNKKEKVEYNIEFTRLVHIGNITQKSYIR